MFLFLNVNANKENSFYNQVNTYNVKVNLFSHRCPNICVTDNTYSSSCQRFSKVLKVMQNQ